MTMELSQADFNFIRDLVRERSAIVLDDDKSYLVKNRLFTLARLEANDNKGGN